MNASIHDKTVGLAMEAYYGSFQCGKESGVYYSEAARRAAMRNAIAAVMPALRECVLADVSAVLERYQDGRVFSNPHTRQVARSIASEVAALRMEPQP